MSLKRLSERYVQAHFGPLNYQKVMIRMEIYSVKNVQTK